MKKVLSLLLATACALIATACSKPNTTNPPESTLSPISDVPNTTTEKYDYEETSAIFTETSKETSQTTKVTTAPKTTTNTSTTAPKEEIPPQAEVYEKYPNLIEIREFKNGLAAFTINYKYYSSNTTYYNLVYFGYININGDVVVDPVYCDRDNIETAFFCEYNSVVKVEGVQNYSLKFCFDIIDTKGNIVFTVGKNNVTNIGPISQGYFWVETQTSKTLSGNTYRVDYYSANTLEKVASYENMRAYSHNMGDKFKYAKNSNVSEYGCALLINSNSPSIYAINDSGIREVNLDISDFKRYDRNTRYTEWENRIKNLPAFSGAIQLDILYSNAKYHKNGLGDADYGIKEWATVRALSQSGEIFYAVVDDSDTVCLQPQQDIQLNTIFWEGLCAAYDVKTSKWGYVDAYGQWRIKPQYESAGCFSSDGFATVNGNIIIDTKNNIILSPQPNE